MKTRRKGTAIRTRCKLFLEKHGWLVDVVEKTGKFIKIKDMFSLFDLIIVGGKGEVGFVQVCSNTPHTHKNLQEFKNKYPLIRIVQYVHKDRKGWEIFEYCNDGKHSVLKVKE